MSDVRVTLDAEAWGLISHEMHITTEGAKVEVPCECDDGWMEGPSEGPAYFACTHNGVHCDGWRKVS